MKLTISQKNRLKNILFTKTGSLRKDTKDIDPLLRGKKLYEYREHNFRYHYNQPVGVAEDFIKILGLKVNYYNDKPRGGKLGDYIKISRISKIRLSDILSVLQ